MKLFAFVTFSTAVSSVAMALAPQHVPQHPLQSNSNLSRRSFVGGSLVATLPVLLAGGVAGAAEAPTLPQTGAKAPPFELPNSRGEGTTSLQKLVQSGKWTILYFYPGAFTQGCTLEARYFQRDIDEYRKLDTQIVGVSVDPPEKNAQVSSGLFA